jgi:hypothetical protein
MIFWVRALGSAEWVELPSQAGLLTAGGYSIAVQTPQPHFRIGACIRHFSVAANGTKQEQWRQEVALKTNDEGVGLVIADIDLQPGFWEVRFSDADLIAELFGEFQTNVLLFQVMPDWSAVPPSKGPSPDLPQFVNQAAPIGQPQEPLQPTTLDSFAPIEFSLMRTHWVGAPGEILALTGRTNRSGRIEITACARGESMLHQQQDIELHPGARTMAFSIRLQLPEDWTQDLVGIAQLHPETGAPGPLVEFTVSPVTHTETAWRSSQPAEDMWRVPSHLTTTPDRSDTDEPALESPAAYPTVARERRSPTGQRPSPIAEFDLPPEFDVDPEFESRDTAIAVGRPLERVAVGQSTETTVPDNGPQSDNRFEPEFDGDTSWESEWEPAAFEPTPAVQALETHDFVSEDELATSELFASPVGVGTEEPAFEADLALPSHSADDSPYPASPPPADDLNTHWDDVATNKRTFRHLLQLTHAVTPAANEAVLAEAAFSPEETPSQVEENWKPESGEAQTEPILLDIGSPLNETVVGGNLFPDMSQAETRESLEPFPLQPSPPVSAEPMTALQLDVPADLRGGECCAIAVRLAAEADVPYVKFWVTHGETDVLLDGPRWLVEFAPDEYGGRVATTHMTVPVGVSTLRFEAIATPQARDAQRATAAIERQIC